MKKLSLFLAAFSAASVFGLFNAHAAEKLMVAATAVPHAEILAFIKPALAKEGVNLQVKVFTDYVQPNMQVFGKKFDANFMQHKPYLLELNKAKNINLVTVVGVHIEPLGAYSTKIKSISALKEGAVVAIPNDPTNRGRALLLMQKNGLITLQEGAVLTATPHDIALNPRKLEIKELEAAMLPRLLHQFDLALINTNYALAAKLNPLKDALFIEGSDSPYVNILAARPDNADSPAMKKLAAALTSPETKRFIEEKYKGAVVPAF